MGKTRNRFAPLARSDQDHWLCVSSGFRVCESEKLPPGTDLKAAFVNALARYAQAGWVLEEFSSAYGYAFAHREEERVRLTIQPTDPARDLGCGSGVRVG